MKNKRLIAEIIIGGNTVMFVDENLLSAEFGALDRGNLTDVVDWGIYANRGSISFIDKQGYFNTTNVNQFRLKGAKVVFYLAKYENTKIATFIVDDVSYDDETKQVDIQLISGLSKWQSKITETSIYPYYETYASEIVDKICERFGVEIAKETDFNGFNITVPCPYIEPSNLWNIVNQVCEATMSRIVETETGAAKITSCFPERTPIVVKPKNIIDIPQNSFVRIVNSSIQYRKITIYEEEVTDSTKSHIRINWDNFDNPSSVDGATLSFSEPIPALSPSSTSYIFASGNYTFNTPHKIFGVYDIQTFLDTKEVVIGDSVTEEFQKEGSFFTSPKIVDDSKIRCSALLATANTIKTNNLGFPSTNKFVLRVETRVPIDGFDDNGTSEERQINKEYADEPIIQIPSSNLVRENSKYWTDSSTWVQLHKYILQETKRRYEKGIECFQIECLFNEYRDESGKVVFDGNDLSQHFQKYDVIIPYVSKNGQTVPLRTNPDGTPKKFRIIGISYSYDGLLKQKLSVQEERYDID